MTTDLKPYICGCGQAIPLTGKSNVDGAAMTLHGRFQHEARMRGAEEVTVTLTREQWSRVETAVWDRLLHLAEESTPKTDTARRTVSLLDEAYCRIQVEMHGGERAVSGSKS